MRAMLGAMTAVVLLAAAGCEKGGRGFDIGDIMGERGGRDRDRDRDFRPQNPDDGNRRPGFVPITGNVGEIGRIQSDMDPRIRDKDWNKVQNQALRIQELLQGVNPPAGADANRFLNDRQSINGWAHKIRERAAAHDQKGLVAAKQNFDYTFNGFVDHWYRGK